MKTPLIALDNVSKRYHQKFVLEGISLSLYAGEITTLIGPNGAGKTTLIRLACGLIEPDTGTVNKAANCRVAYVPQTLNTEHSMPMTVQRFLCLYKRYPQKVMTHALQRVGAEGLLQSALKNLSGGELRRVLLANALLKKPQLLILDEPSAGVDVKGQTAIYELISELRDELGCAVLLVSHNLHIVMSATDHVLCINTHICCAGKPEIVQKHPQYQALFKQSASVAVYTHEHINCAEHHD